jgi:hypothetical protein
VERRPSVGTPEKLQSSSKIQSPVIATDKPLTHSPTPTPTPTQSPTTPTNATTVEKKGTSYPSLLLCFDFLIIFICFQRVGRRIRRAKKKKAKKKGRNKNSKKRDSF